MQRLRTTFTRSRTPTGAEMKTQNSLEVPKQQVRSASFDEMQLESQRVSSQLLKQQSSSSTDERSLDTGLLQVPQATHTQRSHSFDSAAASAGSDDSGTFLEVPRRGKARRSSSTKTPPPCIHCLYLEEYLKQQKAEQIYIAADRCESSSFTYGYSSSDDDTDNDGASVAADDDVVEEDEEDEEDAATGDGTETGGGSYEYDDAALEMDIRLGGLSTGSSIEESRARLPRQMRRHTIGSSVTTSEDEGLDESEHDSPHFGNTLLPPLPTTPCGITFTLSPTNGDCPPFPYAFPIDPGSPPPSPSISFSVCDSPMLELPPPPPISPLELLPHSPIFDLPLPPPPGFSGGLSAAGGDDTAEVPPSPTAMRPRRRSISRQEAIFVEPTGNSLENVSQGEDLKSSVEAVDSVDEASTIATCGSPTAAKHALVVRDIYLTVPDLKRDRAASVDSCFSKMSSAGKTEELQPSEDGCFLTVPNINATRSRSVDIVLPTDEQARYKALAMTGVCRDGFNHENNPYCDYCDGNILEDVHHIFFTCSRFRSAKERLYRTFGEPPSPETFVHHMLRSKEQWNAASDLVAKIMKEMKRLERLRHSNGD
ncbi:eye-specific diacylglycerol kinase-like [Anastrepha ludens]|uniref:eye-specific diacylglycerol kinase-like n=1 Tax=Anastrepha ludens TaxID=28586 RepID=UPI0023B0A13E|nr:eye-specific diacylglycerol kinase-like [Anastrepha ludens]